MWVASMVEDEVYNWVYLSKKPREYDSPMSAAGKNSPDFTCATI
jgi:hypothetical protein